MLRCGLIEIEIVSRGQQAAISFGGRGRERLLPTPGLDHDALGQPRIQDLVPPHHDFSVLVHERLHPLVEVSLERIIIFYPVRPHERSDGRVRAPLHSVHFIAADVEVPIGKQMRHLADEFIQKPVGSLLGWVHGGIKDSPFAFDRIGAFAAGKFRVADKPRCGVPRHVKLGHHADAPIGGVSHELPRFFLGVVEPVGAHFLQLGEFLALDAESLVVGQMPVKYVYFHRGHPVQVALEDLHRNKVAADVDHQPAPGKPRLVLDRDRRHHEAGRNVFDQLQERLEPVQNAQGIRRPQRRA